MQGQVRAAKDMPSSNLQDFCGEIGFSQFEFRIEPTFSVVAVYCMSINTGHCKLRSWWRQPIAWARLLWKRPLEIGGLCVITK